VLQQNSNLTTTNWVTVPPTPNDDGVNVTVMVSPSAAQMFYRLQN
jgi:hypothetical protein